MALVTETDDSLVSPATRASLYTFKPSLGLVESDNIMPTSLRYDIAGPFGKYREMWSMFLITSWIIRRPTSRITITTPTWSPAGVILKSVLWTPRFGSSPKSSANRSRKLTDRWCVYFGLIAMHYPDCSFDTS